MLDLCLSPGQSVLLPNIKYNLLLVLSFVRFLGCFFWGGGRVGGGEAEEKPDEPVHFSWQRCDCWVPQPVSAEGMIQLGSLSLEIPVSLIIILAARHIDLTGPCSFFLCMSVFPSSGNRAPGWRARGDSAPWKAGAGIFR